MRFLMVLCTLAVFATALVGCAAGAEALAASLEANLAEVRASATQLPRRPRVFFEEWDQPLISGIRWVEELIAASGGDPVFPELETAGLAKRGHTVDGRVTRDRVAEVPADGFRRVVIRGLRPAIRI